MYKTANAGHVGTSLSCAELLTFISFGWAAQDDEIILSKGHAAALLYSTLAERGVLTEQDIDTFYKNGTTLAAHPPARGLRGIPFATGSLGHGLSLAAGMVLAHQLKNTPKHVFCVTSDGELDEGSIWEAAAFIIHHKLANVIWLIDRNHLQGFGRTENVLKLEPLSDRLRAMGFYVSECDGHNFISLANAKSELQQASLPGVIICNTIKGRGWRSLENTVDCHYLPMNDEQYELLRQTLTDELNKSIQAL
jgi:transketolase